MEFNYNTITALLILLRRRRPSIHPVVYLYGLNPLLKKHTSNSNGWTSGLSSTTQRGGIIHKKSVKD